MKKNSTLDSKVKKYAALAGGLTAVAGANAQIIHTDINPDMLISGNQMGTTIDFDGDATVDVTLSTFDTVITGVYNYGSVQIPYTFTYVGAVAVAPSGNNWMADSNSDPANIALGNPISSGQSLSSGLGSLGAVNSYYFGSPYNVTYGPYASGNFLSSDGFLGVQFQINGNTHYGWVRCEVTSGGDTLSVKEYAYQSIADSSINAGATDNGPVGITEIVDFAEIRNMNNKVMINLTEINDNIDAVVTNISGQQVINENLNQTTTELDLNGMASGVYLVSVRSDKGIVTKRVYVK